MNGISDDALMKALGRQLSLAVAKQAVASSNLANLDTPGYRTHDVEFTDVLADELQRKPSATDPAHLTGGGTGTRLEEAGGLAARRDGNNVQLDRELLQMSRASTDFAAAQTALAAKFRLIRYAINEGR